MNCAGCNEEFTRATQYVRHIEQDECQVISAEHFQLQRAEKQILRDAWVAQTDPTGGSAISSNPPKSDSPSEGGGVSLVDFQPPSVQDAASTLSLEPMRSLSSGLSSPPTGTFRRLALENFPALPTQKRSYADSHLSSTRANSNLLDLDESEVRSTEKSIWGTKATSKFATVSVSELAVQASEASSSTPSERSGKENRPRMFAKTTNPTLSAPDPSHLPVNDITATNPHVQTARSMAPTSLLDPENYWNELQQFYLCPGTRCGRSFQTNEQFKAHLLSSAHVEGKTQCPNCLNQFRSTYALIAHCEAGSKRCQIRKAPNFNEILRELTAGALGTNGYLDDGSVKFTANQVHEW